MAKFSIKAILDEIANESSDNNKIKILTRYKNVPTLRDVLYLAKSKRVKFHIKKIPDYKCTSKETLAEAIKQLGWLSDRTYTGKAASDFLSKLLSVLSEDDAYVIKRIIAKDLKIGMGTTNINKVFSNLIEKTPYMGAIPFSKEAVESLLAKGVCDSEIKMDGRYCNAVVQFGDGLLESREGNSTYLPTRCKLMLELNKLPDCVLNGELTIPGIPRYISNGIISSIISIEEKVRNDEDVLSEISGFKKKHGDFLEMSDRIVFTAWDTITLEEYFARKSKTPRDQRKANLRKLLKCIASENIQMIRSKKVHTYKEAMEHFYEVLSDGEEGTIIKSENGEWKNGKPDWQVKLKLEMNIDMEIIDFLYGTGKNRDVISSITTVSSCGKVEADVAGMDEKTMAYVTKNMKKLKGTIMDVKCAGLSKAKNGTYSLLHPRAGKSGLAVFRDDKSKADSLAHIIKIENAIKGI